MIESRAWQVALSRMHQIEAAWKDPVARQRAILDCRNWLARQTHLPHLHKLESLLDPTMTPQQFQSVLVPVERQVSRVRVTDVDILETDLPVAGSSAGHPMSLTVVVDSMRSAFNLGGVFRTAECLGVSRVWLCGYTAEPTHAQVAQAAMGAEHLVSWRHWPRVGDALAALRDEGVRTVALETVRDAIALHEYAWPFPSALILGNERFGLDPDTVCRADAVIRIPMHGQKNSLNVVSAFAIAAYAARAAWDQSNIPSAS